MTDRYAVIGNPVTHSKSPLIHAEFARQTKQDLSYVAIHAATDAFEDEVNRFRESGGRGVNITLPFKHRAYTIAGERSARAEEARAANTLILSTERIAADNTDGVGLIRDITHNLACELRGRRILLMGAGGAAYGVCGPLLDQAPESLTIANRTLDKAHALREHFVRLRSDVTSVQALSYAEIGALQFDVVINATSAGLDNAMPPLPARIFKSDALAYDMVYANTPFLTFAQARGVRAADGLGMLVEQAAESFYLWRGVRPQTPPVIAMLRSSA